MTTDELAEEFCRTWAHAPGIQVMVYSNPHMTFVVDVGEFRDDWGASRPEGVREYVAGRPARLTALRETGHMLGCDPEVEYLATLDIPCKET